MSGAPAPVLHLTGVGKSYRRPGGRRRQPPPSLEGVDLDVVPGEVVGVIGRNGAGKSTLLKVAAGVTEQTTGTVVRPSRIAPLIEVGAGFHPELSGRDNVLLNAKLLGLGRRQAAARFDQIVAFSQLEAVIDRPVREYSSGMFMRLGFAVAVHTDPQLLVIDEVLAVGDLPFQVRCLERIRSLRDAGVGVLFVSHDLTAVQNLCDRVLLLERGRPAVLGPVADAVGTYHRLLTTGEAPGDGGAAAGERFQDRPPSGEVRIGEVTVAAAGGGGERALWQPGDLVDVDVEVVAETPTGEAIPGIQLVRADLGVVARFHDDLGALVPPLRAGEQATIRFRLRLNLTEGAYRVDVAVARRDWSAIMGNRIGAATIGVGRRYGATGMADLAPEVEVEGPRLVRP